MSTRKTTKNLKKFALPLAFVVGLASFPLGSLLMGQVKKSHRHSYVSQARSRANNHHVHHAVHKAAKHHKKHKAHH